MNPTVIVHCAQPLLGLDRGERGRDYLRSFERACDVAAETSARLMLVCGRLLAGTPDPAMFSALDAVLTRLRDGGTSLWTTAEHDERGWLEYFASRRLCGLLSVRGDGIELPEAEDQGVRLVGLGRPRGRAAVRARIGRLHARDRDRSIALLDASSGPPEQDDLRAILSKVAYVAIGGGDRPLQDGTRACDPGPVVRLSLNDAPEPTCRIVRLHGGDVELEQRPIADRPLLTVEIDGDGTPAEAEKILRQLQRRKRVNQPLLRIDRRGGGKLSDDELLRLAKSVLNPITCEICDLDSPPIDPSRVALEHRVLHDLTSTRGPAYSDLARTVLDALMTSPDSGTDAAAEQIVRYLESVVDPAT